MKSAFAITSLANLSVETITASIKAINGTQKEEHILKRNDHQPVFFPFGRTEDGDVPRGYIIMTPSLEVIVYFEYAEDPLVNVPVVRYRSTRVPYLFFWSITVDGRKEMFHAVEGKPRCYELQFLGESQCAVKELSCIS
jgi:hypothetical protein